MKGVIVVRLSPEMRAEIERIRISIRKVEDAFRQLGAVSTRSAEAMAKACECLRVEQDPKPRRMTRYGAQKQVKRFRERRRFPIPKSQKMR